MIHRHGICMMFALGLLATPSLSAAQALLANGIDCLSISKSQGKVAHYWTPERMAAAEPSPLPDLSGEELHLLDSEEAVPGAGSRSDEAPRPRPWVSPGQPWPADVSEWPFRTAGRLFYTVGKIDKWCTAELTGTGQTLLTAAHCVRSGRGKNAGKWHSNFCFVRAYQDGKGHRMKLRRVATWKKWVGTAIPNYSFDYAIFSTADSSPVGWLGLRSPLLSVFWTSIGYPESYGEGELMYQALGWRYQIRRGRVAMEGNPMDEGSSGGAWIDSSKDSPGSYAVGLNSHRSEGRMQSPLFDHQTAFLLSYVAKGCR